MRILLLLAVCISAVLAYNGHKVFQIVAKNKHEIEAVARLRNVDQLDFWSPINTRGKPVDVMVTPEVENSLLNYLHRYGIQYKIIINDVGKVLRQSEVAQRIKVDKGKISFAKYNDFNEINDYIKQLAKDHSDIASIQNIGKSFEGRELNVLKISTDPSANKPVIFIDGGIHAREWMAPAQTTYIINQLVENAANSGLLEKVDWHILPVLNPDGYQYTHSSTANRFWRKTRSQGRLCRGVDANRNFDYYWGLVGTSNQECSDIYRGPEAFSEVETQALSNYLLANKETIKLYLTFHSYGNYLLYPWGYTSALPEDADELQALGELVANTIHKVAGTVYTVGSSTNVLYPAAGGSDDWAKAVAGVQLAYTIELSGGGSQGFNPPPQQIIPFVTETWEGVKAYHHYIQNKFGK